MAYIYLGKSGEYRTEVDDDYFATLSKWRWNYKRSSRRYHYAIYARRGNQKIGTILLSHLVLEMSGRKRPTKKHTADHIDGDSLNDTRNNLRWATKKQQTKNRRPNRPRALANPDNEGIPF